MIGKQDDGHLQKVLQTAQAQSDGNIENIVRQSIQSMAANGNQSLNESAMALLLSHYLQG